MQQTRVRAVAASFGRGLAGVEGDAKSRFPRDGQPEKQEQGQGQKKKQIPFGKANKKSKGKGKGKGKGKSKSKGKRQIRFGKGKIEKPGRSARRECGAGVSGGVSGCVVDVYRDWGGSFAIWYRKWSVGRFRILRLCGEVAVGAGWRWKPQYMGRYQVIGLYSVPL